MENLQLPSVASDEALYPAAIILPVGSFLACALCVPPIVWHLSQRNIAAGSLILWITIANFFNFVNPLIWPRGNVEEWWDGNIWCDIHVRVQVGAQVGIAASVVMIARKLAGIMDTQAIMVYASKHNRAMESLVDVVWCWIYPSVLIVLYYIVQSVRYNIFSIIGCVSTFDPSWPSIVLSQMWGPITMVVATGYSLLLLYRLFRYRLEFDHIMAARNITRSRFFRLTTLAMLIIIVYMPYSFYLLFQFAREVHLSFIWSEVHGPDSGSFAKYPLFGKVPTSKWIQVISGYLVFFIFSTGADSQQMYLNLLLSIRLRKLFPCVHKSQKSEGSSFFDSLTAKSWRSYLPRKGKGMLSSSNPATDKFDSSSMNTWCGLSMNSSRGRAKLDSISLKDDEENGLRIVSPMQPDFLDQIVQHNNTCGSCLPFSTCARCNSSAEDEPLPNRHVATGVFAQVWASRMRDSLRGNDADVRVTHEVYRESAVGEQGEHVGNHGV